MSQNKGCAVWKFWRQSSFWLSVKRWAKGVILVVAALIGCLVFPSYAQSAPLKTVIHDLINECLHDQNGPFAGNEIVDLKHKDKPQVFKLSQADKMNGIEYKALYYISYIDRFRLPANPSQWSPWYQSGAEFKVDIVKGVLNFLSTAGESVCRYTLDMNTKNSVTQHHEDIYVESQRKKFDELITQQEESEMQYSGMNKTARMKIKNFCASGTQMRVKYDTDISNVKTSKPVKLYNEKLPVKYGTVVNGIADDIHTLTSRCRIQYTDSNGNIISGDLQLSNFELLTYYEDFRIKFKNYCASGKRMKVKRLFPFYDKAANRYNVLPESILTGIPDRSGTKADQCHIQATLENGTLIDGEIPISLLEPLDDFIYTPPAR